MKPTPDMRFKIEGKGYLCHPKIEQRVFKEMKANHKPDSIVVCRDWKTKEILDELELQDLI